MTNLKVKKSSDVFEQHLECKFPRFRLIASSIFKQVLKIPRAAILLPILL